MNEDKITNINYPCQAWCFLFGIMGPTLPKCILVSGHEGEHQTTIEIFVEPKAKFTITWDLVE